MTGGTGHAQVQLRLACRAMPCSAAQRACGGVQHARPLGCPAPWDGKLFDCASRYLFALVSCQEAVGGREVCCSGQGAHTSWGAGAARVARALMDTAAVAAACREVERALKLSDRAAMYL